MKLYHHPRSSYSQKVLIALHEKGAAFTPVVIDPREPAGRAVLDELSPIGKMPVLVLDDGWKIPESSIIIEYLDTHVDGGTRLIPAERDQARQTRFHDRLADLYVNDQVLVLVRDADQPERRDPERTAAARARLDRMFAGLDQHLARRRWIMGDGFTMADCALVPSLGYARTFHPFDRWKNLTTYTKQTFERPSVRAATEGLTSSRAS